MVLIDDGVEKNNNIDTFQELLNEITKRRVQPEDRYEIAAIIESMGFNDSRVSEVFGADDVFSLASEIWDAIRSNIVFSPHEPIEKRSLAAIITNAVRNFLRGSIFAFPMAISVFSMLTLKLSLWSYENLTLELATSIAIGTILSFLTVGGFTQSIARRGFFYIGQNYYNMARRITFFFIRLGYIATLFIAAAFLAFNAFFEVFPFRMAIVLVLYYFFLTAIWLSVTVMYILRKELLFSGLITVGIILVFVFFYIFNIGIIFSQVISLTAVSLLSIVLVMHYFKEAEKKMEKGIAPSLPRKSITLYSVMPYFTYGFTYFAFIYADRIMAWSTNSEGFMPYLIWFRGHYELGLDFALLMLIFPIGIIEVVLGRLMMDLESSQKFCSAYEADSLSKGYLTIYYQRLCLCAVVSLLAAAFTYGIVRFLDSRALIPRLSNMLFDGNNKITITHFVLIIALLSYAILSVAMMNTLILFSLSQPEMANRSILPALLTNIATGFLLSRWIDYYFAVFGLLAGAIVFLVLSTTRVFKVLRHLDYYLYAAA